MDCKTARLLLLFDRPRAGEMGDDEARALQEHLALCGACAAAARAERRQDAHLGRATRDLPVPEGLRGRLVDRLAADRGARDRRRMLHGARALAAAAALLLV